MALVHRGGRPYLYKSIRRGGRVTSEYVASGEAAVIIDRMEAIDRDERDLRRWELAERRKESEELERGSTRSAGARPREPRRRWRRRGFAGTTGASGGGAVATDVVRVEASERIMDRWATGRLIDWAAGKKADEATKGALHRELEAVSTELASADPRPVERMLAEAAAVAWFALRLHEAQYAGGSNSEKGLTIAQAEYHQRRIDRAHRRYLATLKTLATVRELAVPAVQVNIAKKQVNVAGGG